MSILLTDSTPQQDGFYMPAEFEPIQKVWMVWPYRADNWRQQAIPAKKAYADVALAINKFCEVGVLVNPEDYQQCAIAYLMISMLSLCLATMRGRVILCRHF
nr:agmatine deiminase family protein [Psychrobacter sp. JCM 18900]